MGYRIYDDAGQLYPATVKAIEAMPGVLRVVHSGQGESRHWSVLANNEDEARHKVTLKCILALLRDCSICRSTHGPEVTHACE